jgi:catechol 2,3-dioxygenase-like lactoylglutathione lyase family enzyme
MLGRITHLIAGMPVSDLEVSADWYSRLFGMPPTLRVDDLDAVLERLSHQGIECQTMEIYSNDVRHVNVPDPDGNAIALAGALECRFVGGAGRRSGSGLARVVAMTDSEDYCDFCDLPRSQCVHGQPPPPPPVKAANATPSPRKRPTVRTPSAATRPASRWTTPEALKPLILAVLQEAGGTLEADDVFLELEILTEDRLLPGDHESTPEGELRWRYAARRARVALIDEGAMVKTQPGVWQLAEPR